MADLYTYEVPRRNGVMTVKLSEEDAELIYGDAAKRKGDANQGEVQPVRTPPWTEPVPAEGESDPATSDAVKKAPVRRNKRAASESEKTD